MLTLPKGTRIDTSFPINPRNLKPLPYGCTTSGIQFTGEPDSIAGVFLTDPDTSICEIENFGFSPFSVGKIEQKGGRKGGRKGRHPSRQDMKNSRGASPPPPSKQDTPSPQDGAQATALGASGGDKQPPDDRKDKKRGHESSQATAKAKSSLTTAQRSQLENLLKRLVRQIDGGFYNAKRNAQEVHQLESILQNANDAAWNNIEKMENYQQVSRVIHSLQRYPHGRKQSRGTTKATSWPSSH